MPVYLDQQPMVVPHDSVAGAIEAARQVAEARGRLVIDVLLDGRRLIDEELHEPSSEPLGARELRFTSAEPRVSCDYNGDAHSATIDLLSTQVIGDLVKVLAWYDNEVGYATRLYELAKFVAAAA